MPKPRNDAGSQNQWNPGGADIMPEDIHNLRALLGQLEYLAQTSDRISLRMVVQAVGSRSFAPILLLAGLILFSPLSGIPGVPTLMAMLVLLVSVQMLAMRKHLWLPAWLLQRSIPRDKLLKALRWLKRPTTILDQWMKPRLSFLVYRTGSIAIASICLAIAVFLPFMEIVPFSATIAGLALTTFGLSLVAHDGVLALIAVLITGLVVGVIFRSLM